MPGTAEDPLEEEEREEWSYKNVALTNHGPYKGHCVDSPLLGCARGHHHVDMG